MSRGTADTELAPTLGGVDGVCASRASREAGFAYKDLSAVVDVLHRLDISRKVVSLTPIGNIKG